MHVSVMAPHPPAIPEEQYATVGVGKLVRTPGMDESDRSDKPPYIQALPMRTTRLIEKYPRIAAAHPPLGGRPRGGRDAGTRNPRRAEQDPRRLRLGQRVHVGRARRVREVRSVPGVGQGAAVPVLAGRGGDRPNGRPTGRIARPRSHHPRRRRTRGPADGRSQSARRHLDPRRAPAGVLAGSEHPTPTWASIQTPTDQYVEYYDEADETTFREYYDLSADPAQLENLLGDSDPKNDPEVAPMSERLAALRDCVASSCP